MGASGAAAVATGLWVAWTLGATAEPGQAAPGRCLLSHYRSLDPRALAAVTALRNRYVSDHPHPGALSEPRSQTPVLTRGQLLAQRPELCPRHVPAKPATSGSPALRRPRKGAGRVDGAPRAGAAPAQGVQEPFGPAQPRGSAGVRAQHARAHAASRVPRRGSRTAPSRAPARRPGLSESGRSSRRRKRR